MWWIWLSLTALMAQAQNRATPSNVLSPIKCDPPVELFSPHNQGHEVFPDASSNVVAATLVTSLRPPQRGPNYGGGNGIPKGSASLGVVVRNIDKGLKGSSGGTWLIDSWLAPEVEGLMDNVPRIAVSKRNLSHKAKKPDPSYPEYTPRHLAIRRVREDIWVPHCPIEESIVVYDLGDRGTLDYSNAYFAEGQNKFTVASQCTARLPEQPKFSEPVFHEGALSFQIRDTKESILATCLPLGATGDYEGDCLNRNSKRRIYRHKLTAILPGGFLKARRFHTALFPRFGIYLDRGTHLGFVDLMGGVIGRGYSYYTTDHLPTVILNEPDLDMRLVDSTELFQIFAASAPRGKKGYVAAFIPWYQNGNPRDKKLKPLIFKQLLKVQLQAGTITKGVYDQSLVGASLAQQKHYWRKISPRQWTWTPVKHKLLVAEKGFTNQAPTEWLNGASNQPYDVDRDLVITDVRQTLNVIGPQVNTQPVLLLKRLSRLQLLDAKPKTAVMREDNGRSLVVWQETRNPRPNSVIDYMTLATSCWSL